MIKHSYMQDNELVEVEYETGLCYSREWLEQNDSAGWQVQLSTGEMVYEDDDRPGFIPSAWERLCLHCSETGSHIESMWIRFRDHVECVGTEQDGFYLFKEIRHHPSWEKPEFYYIAGVLHDETIHCTKWRLPEILVDSYEKREEPAGVTNVLGLSALIRRNKKDGLPATVS
tara:strand:+ start:2441 stop:2956 length:516 start_codon:yes stop_codon:yes gene_type:complete